MDLSTSLSPQSCAFPGLSQPLHNVSGLGLDQADFPRRFGYNIFSWTSEALMLTDTHLLLLKIWFSPWGWDDSGIFTASEISLLQSLWCPVPTFTGHGFARKTDFNVLEVHFRECPPFVSVWGTGRQFHPPPWQCSMSHITSGAAVSVK